MSTSVVRGGDRLSQEIAPRVEHLFVYPIKSLAGVSVSSACVAERGFAGDRRYLLIDEAGRMLTQREHPRLARVRLELDERAETITLDQTLTLPLHPSSSLSIASAPRCLAQIWDDTVEAAVIDDRGYFSEVMGQPTRLVHLPDDVRRPVSMKHGRPHDHVSFADAFPFLLVSSSSLAALSGAHEAAGGEPLDVRRFRPNLVVGGLEAWAEEAPTFRSFRVGATTFHAVKRCSRCVMVDHDPDTGDKLASALRTLATTRRLPGDTEVYFGQNLVHDFAPAEGDAHIVSVGDRVSFGEA